ncbi:MAG: DNA polymerase III subunit gamma/tau [Polyangiaceae bacterium]|nr:DNA polymerase III subunit gamma/tau [Polyangiaceae bacterium]
MRALPGDRRRQRRDVQEIDGASYNGVDEVRRLQEMIPYRPARDRFKIFIVDEVHMLSQSAWNAFLKTLEEPPPHVKFIFATTEVHKVPITILSRVQRFDFKLIPTRLIADSLRKVTAKEGVDADDAALALISREAAGSMRDAMSLLDQVIAWGGPRLTGPDVARVLGVASHQVLHDITGALVRGDAARALGVVAELSREGQDIPHVARDLLALLRDVVVAKVCPEPGELLDLADEERRDVMELAKHENADDLVRLHQGFSQGFDDVVRSGQPRAALEMLLVRLARRPPLLPIDDLLGRLRELERRLGSAPRRDVGRESPPLPDAPRRPEARPRPRIRARRSARAGRRTAARNPHSHVPRWRRFRRLLPRRAPSPSRRSALRLRGGGVRRHLGAAGCGAPGARRVLRARRSAHGDADRAGGRIRAGQRGGGAGGGKGSGGRPHPSCQRALRRARARRGRARLGALPGLRHVGPAAGAGAPRQGPARHRGGQTPPSSGRRHGGPGRATGRISSSRPTDVGLRSNPRERTLPPCFPSVCPV